MIIVLNFGAKCWKYKKYLYVTIQNMKNVSRAILSIFIIFLLATPTFAQKIDTDKINFDVVKFTETKNPVTYKYILDYANMLYEKINTTIPFKENWGLEYRYKLHTDGSITDLKPMPLNTPYKGKPINKIFEEFLISTPPPPFPDNMEIGDVYIELYVDTYIVDKITIYYLRRSVRAPQPGNYIYIHIPVKNYQKIFKFYR